MRLRLLPERFELGWTPYAWLVYLTLPIAYGIPLNRGNPAGWLIDGGVAAAFLVLYFRGFWVRPPALLWITFAIVALAVVSVPRNAGASVYFIYAAAFLGEATDTSGKAMRWLGVIIAIIALEVVFVGIPLQSWIPAVIFSVIVGGSNVHFAEMRRKNTALLRAHKTAEQLAAVAERERIARDLHDLLGHTLSVIVIKSELASKLTGIDPERAAAEIRDVERISRDALQEVRRAIDGYRGERVTDEIAKARVALDAAGVTLVTHVDPVALDVEAERALALALREAVTNIVRHARATRCEITLLTGERGTQLIVQDDGVGGTHPEGAGLAGMRARVVAAGGSVGRDGRTGTRVTLTVPHRSHTPAELAAS